jgi:predicted  nucleic acid-binding Zn-ribbon protein
LEGEDAIFSWFKSEKAVEDKTERLERLEKGMRRLEEEWTEVYHKFRVLQMRVAKQVQRLDANSSHEEPQKAEGDGQSGASSLSPRMQRIQEQILERRRRGAPVVVSKEGGE